MRLTTRRPWRASRTIPVSALAAEFGCNVIDSDERKTRSAALNGSAPSPQRKRNTFDQRDCMYDAGHTSSKELGDFVKEVIACPL